MKTKTKKYQSGGTTGTTTGAAKKSKNIAIGVGSALGTVGAAMQTAIQKNKKKKAEKEKAVDALKKEGKKDMTTMKMGGVKKPKMMVGGTKPKAMYGKTMKSGMMKMGGTKKK